MAKFKVYGAPLIDREDMHYYDKVEEYENIVNGEVIDADDEEAALDEFHNSQPIKVLDDWDIRVEEIN